MVSVRITSIVKEDLAVFTGGKTYDGLQVINQVLGKVINYCIITQNLPLHSIEYG